MKMSPESTLVAQRCVHVAETFVDTIVDTFVDTFVDKFLGKVVVHDFLMQQQMSATVSITIVNTLQTKSFFVRMLLE